MCCSSRYFRAKCHADWANLKRDWPTGSKVTHVQSFFSSVWQRTFNFMACFEVTIFKNQIKKTILNFALFRLDKSKRWQQLLRLCFETLLVCPCLYFAIHVQLYWNFKLYCFYFFQNLRFQIRGAAYLRMRLIHCTQTFTVIHLSFQIFSCKVHHYISHIIYYSLVLY